MHNCPVCEQACYCGGDIDDIDAGDEAAQDDCCHCDGDGETDGEFEEFNPEDEPIQDS